MVRFQMAFVSLLVCGESFTEVLPRELESISCRKEVLEQLSQWERATGFKKRISVGSHIFRSATDTIGVWLEIRSSSRHAVTLLRMAPDRLTRITWAPKSCAPSLVTSTYKFDNDRLKNDFDDSFLKTIVEQNWAGILYAWSPHMPYSVVGLSEVKAAARLLKLNIYVVLDPHAVARLAQKTTFEHGWPSDHLKRMESQELFNRGMGNHYPSLLLFKRGKIIGPLLPGLKKEKTYVKFIKEQLAGN